jgi:hypothetical protein
MTTTSPLADTALAPTRMALARRLVRADVTIAVAAFAGLCLAVLLRAPQMLEPDDYAYRASIVALGQLHILLSNTQYLALERRLGGSGSGGGAIQQWHQAASGLWISEKNPGYPFLAVPFQWLGILRVAPLFYGGLGCAGLWFGAQRWLGRWGGTVAVVLFCTSGAALAFAWRATMETFTDASLVAAGAGALLWALLAIDALQGRRCLVGAAGLAALALATWSRYTDAVAFAIAVGAVALLGRPAGATWRTLQIWAGTVVLALAGMLTFNAYAYGGWNRTGYAGGEITFSFGAISPNLEHMPAHLLRAMPMLLLGVIAIGWITVRAFTAARRSRDQRHARRVDAIVAALLGITWIGIWGLYLSYAWTAQMSAQSGSAIHVIRFYLPALGPMALLAAWPLVHVLRRGGRRGAIAVAVVVVALSGAGAWSYQSLVATGMGPGGGPGGGARGAAGLPPSGVGGTPHAPSGSRGFGPPPSSGATGSGKPLDGRPGATG